MIFMDIYDEITNEILTMRVDTAVRNKETGSPKLYKMLLILSTLDYHDDCGDETKAFNNRTHVNNIFDFFIIYLENDLIQSATYSDKENTLRPKAILKKIREMPLYFIRNTKEGNPSKYFFNELSEKYYTSKKHRPRRNDNMPKYFEIKMPEGVDLEKMANVIRAACISRIFKESGILIGSSITHSLKLDNVDTTKYHRLGQNQFRRKLLDKYNKKCAFCSFGVEHTLIASHAKRWVDCNTVREKLDENNGFLLCANHDKMFDRGYLSINIYNKHFILSDKLANSEKIECLNSLPTKQFPHKITTEMIKYLKHHSERLK